LTFFVAFNAPFDIFGEATNLTTSGDLSSLDYRNIRYNFLEFPPNSAAQRPSIGGNGIVLGGAGSNNTLADLALGPVKVFDGGQKTALNPGNIFSQSSLFASLYRSQGASVTGTSYDFSMGTGHLGADVTHTIYAP